MLLVTAMIFKSNQILIIKKDRKSTRLNSSHVSIYTLSLHDALPISYEEVIDHERFVENQEIVVLLFVKPTNQDAMDIVQEFEYIHYNSSKYCSIYAVGYSNDFQKQSDPHYKK